MVIVFAGHHTEFPRDQGTARRAPAKGENGAQSEKFINTDRSGCVMTIIPVAIAIHRLSWN